MNITCTVGGFSNWDQLGSAGRRALPPALIAAGNVGRNAIRRALRGGYYSSLGNHGDWVTGNSLNHVTLSDPVVRPNSGYITVGTDLLYNLYWEVGHHNLFTRNYERDERWAPAWREANQPMTQAFVRVYRRVIQQDASGRA